MAFGKCQNTKNPIFCSTPPKMKRNRPPPLPFIFGYFLLPPKFSAAQDGKNASRGLVLWRLTKAHLHETLFFNTEFVRGQLVVAR